MQWWKTKTVMAVAAMALPLAAGAAGLQDEKSIDKEKAKMRERTHRVVVAEGMAGARRSYLGVDTRDVTADRVQALKLREERGVEITTVDQDAPAGKAGLKVGDVITEFNGQRVEGQEQLRRMIQETPPGRSVALGIMRDGVPQSVQAVLAERRRPRIVAAPRIRIPDMPDFPEPPEIAMGGVWVESRNSAKLGVVVDDLTKQLAEFFGAREGQGVLVKSVEKGSPAEVAGVRAGDVIVRLGNETIGDRGDLRRALRSAKGTLPLAVLRDKREQVVNVTFPERNEGRTRGSFRLENGDDEFEVAVDMKELEKHLAEIGPAIENVANRVAAAMALNLTPIAEAVSNAVNEIQIEFDSKMRL